MANFAEQMRQWADKTGNNVDDVIQATVLDMSKRIIQKTPVGNPDLWKGKAPEGYTGGQAKGNWFATIGVPYSGVATGITDKTGGMSISRAVATSRGASGKVYYLVNNLPYMRRLEYGWSTQAPEGMVRTTIAEFNAAIAKAMRKT